MITYDAAFKKSLEYFDGDELAAQVFLGKYALTSPNEEILEETPNEMHQRLAKEFARIERKYENPLTEKQIYDYLQNFKYVIPQGSPMAGIGNSYQLLSLSNCYVVESPYDSYGGICKTDQELVQLMKRRAGVGVDISTIRPKGQPTKNAAGTTDGIAVFMERYSNSCREVAQNGRRGAEMITINCHHPEVKTFIEIKQDKKKVTGANISVKLTDEFMEAVRNDKKYQQRWPVDSDNPQVEKWVDAKKIWNLICQCAWASAEPGILFWDNVINESPAGVYDGFKESSTNPCCLEKDTLIYTKEGYKKIKDLKNKPFVAVVDGQEYVATKGSWVSGIADIYRLETEEGMQIDLTLEHQLYSLERGWVTAKDLKIGEKIRVDESERLQHDPDMVTFKALNFLKTEEVWDAEVSEIHAFNANGFYAHNSEIPLSPNDSCRLLLLNSTSYVIEPFAKNSKFDYNLFAKHVQIAQRLMDDLIDLELECIDKILNKIQSDPEPEEVKLIEISLWNKIRKACENGRRTGLGVTGIGDTVAFLNQKYGSDKSIETIENVYKTLAINSYKSSCILAKERGAFPIFNAEKEKNNPFIKRLLKEDKELSELYYQYGRRNIANLTTAPCGSVSILSQTTSGIEPVFLLSYKRRRKINPNDKKSKVDFIDELGDKWQEYKVYHHGFKKWMDVTGKTEKELKESPYYKSTSNDIDWKRGVALQATAQKWVDHAISRTCNLPSDVSVEVVKQIYEEAWKRGCKGFTIYRDGSRSGVLVADTAENSRNKLKENHAPKRPEKLPCDIYHMQVKGERWNFFVGLYEEKPYEVFAGRSKHIHLPRSRKSGFIMKNGTYNLYTGEADNELIIEDLATVFENPTESAFTRTVSLALRHGAPIQYVVEQIEKGADKENEMFTLSKGLMRVLKNYVKDGTKPSTKKCPKCDGKDLIYQEGCLSCKACGYSRCS